MADRFKVIDTPIWTLRDFAILLVFSFVMLWSHTALAQVYGLGFSSHAELKENRTQLDLNPNHFFSFHDKFMVSFSMTLRQNEPAYFGYILRIIDDENKNVDLIYNYQSAGTNTRFELVYGEESTNKSARVNFNEISAEWVEIKLAYDYQKQEFLLISPDTTILAFPVKFSPRIKILFGASDYKNFKTTDVPPMNIKDIRIFHDGKLNHEWPLNESAGNIVFDVKGSTNALATNPEWLKPRFQNWVKRFEGEVPGIAGVAFNAAEELIYLIGEEALIVYSVRDNLIDTVLYQNNPVVLKQGCQAFYDSNNSVLVSYNIDQKTISTLDPQSGIWEQMVAEAYPLTIYWHHNKFFSATDSSLYILGGYGQHEYKNSVTRYSFQLKTWEKLLTSNEVFHPRYLSALGNLNDTLFVLGGYGSLSGKQIMNPGIYNDLFTYHPGSGKFTLRHNSHLPAEDLAFANSMIIDSTTRSFYVLAFPFFKYESSLQLLKGHLDDPGLEFAGNKIPYFFQDILSYADLFYCKTSHQLACVTLLNNNNNQTQVRLYTIGYPPSLVYDEPIGGNKTNQVLFYLISSFFLALVVYVLFRLFKKPQQKGFRIAKNQPISVGDDSEKSVIFPEELHKTNAVLFFGDFQIINNKGDDITNKFTPLMKELFLLIWLHSVKDKGVSPERIIELFWFDKDEKSARNNLSVNIVKLKALTGELDTLVLSRQTGYWKMSFSNDVMYNDYLECRKISENKDRLNKGDILELIRITQKGHFLESSAFEWLDEFKADISNLIIDTLTGFAEKSGVESDPDFILHLADTVLHFEMLNEEAIQLKCRALTATGKHNLAKEAFTKFARDYKSLYNIEYGKTLTDLLNT